MATSIDEIRIENTETTTSRTVLCEKFLATIGMALVGFILLAVGITLVILHDQCEATHCRIIKRYQCSTGLSGAVPIKSTRQSCGRFREKAWQCVLEDVPCVVVDKQGVPTGLNRFIQHRTHSLDNTAQPCTR